MALATTEKSDATLIRTLFASCGLQLPRDEPEDALLAKAQGLLHSLVQKQEPCEQPWASVAEHPESQTASGSQAQYQQEDRSSQMRTEERAPPVKRKRAPGSGYMLFVNENFNRVRTELSKGDGPGMPCFSSIAKEAAAQWRSLSRSDQSEYTTRAAALRDTLRPDAALVPSEPRTNSGPSKGRAQSLHSLKRKWVEHELSKWEGKLREEWEALCADEVSAQLVAWRIRGLAGAKDTQERLGSTLDALISQRMSDPVIPGGSATLLSRLGLSNTHLPHPAVLFVEWEAAALECSGADLEAAAAQCLQRYRNLSPLRLAWSQKRYSHPREKDSAAQLQLRKALGEYNTQSAFDPEHGQKGGVKNLEEEIERYRKYSELLRTQIVDSVTFLHQDVSLGSKVLVEGANAALLDVDFGSLRECLPAEAIWLPEAW